MDSWCSTYVVVVIIKSSGPQSLFFEHILCAILKLHREGIKLTLCWFSVSPLVTECYYCCCRRDSVPMSSAVAKKLSCIRLHRCCCCFKFKFWETETRVRRAKRALFISFSQIAGSWASLTTLVRLGWSSLMLCYFIPFNSQLWTASPTVHFLVCILYIQRSQSRKGNSSVSFRNDSTWGIMMFAPQVTRASCLLAAASTFGRLDFHKASSSNVISSFNNA